jgi:myo-inositol-1(or 4)-monophosphatase
MSERDAISFVPEDAGEELRFVIELAARAGEVVLEQYGKVRRQTKTHAATTEEAVTEADRASQRLIISELRRRFPGDGIIGEESDSGQSITFDCKNPLGRNWVIDPIDGTNNFIAGMGAFAVCIGLLDAGEPVLGVVFDVVRGWMYAGERGAGGWLNGRAIAVCPEGLADSSLIMLTSNLLNKQNQCPAWAVRWLGQTNWKVRILGSAALEAMAVAAGVAHGAVTVNGKLWDIAAPAAIVQAAGGVITDLAGGNIFPFDLRGYIGAKVPFVAAAPAAREQLLAEIRNNP